MAARAMWKAELNFDKVRVPVKLYAAVEDKRIHFRLLNAADETPVKQQMMDPQSNDTVASEEIKRAVEVERGVYVVLTPEEQAALEPKPSREITIERVVDAKKVDERWFDRPYYLGPDGDDESYFALAAALEGRSWLGIAHWVMRNKSYTGALYGSNGYLMLDTLRHVQELVQIDAVRAPPSRAPDPRELKLAEQLVSTLEDPFNATDYKDEHREQVMALLKAKAQGKVVRLPKARKRKDTGSLIEHLQASLKAGRKAAHGR